MPGVQPRLDLTSLSPKISGGTDDEKRGGDDSDIDRGVGGGPASPQAM